MEIELTEAEARILGCLVEKQLTTPESYPLSLNSLKAACNQKTNRYPVMELTDGEINIALDRMRGKGFVFQLTTSVGRVPKYEHNLNRFNFSPEETAVICILLLRGAQTPGEIRGRTGRMFNFETLEKVEQVLFSLAERADGPFVTKLERQPGVRESRWMHLMCGNIAIINDILIQPKEEQCNFRQAEKDDRIGRIENDIDDLRKELQSLREQFAQFRKQFE